MIVTNAWSSITVFAKNMIAECAAANPGAQIEFIDWEAHANIAELPNVDLIGPASLAITEHTSNFITVNFSIGVSTFKTDKNLFRQRDYIARIFEKLRPESKVTYYDAQAGASKSVLIVTDGTMVAPMSKAEARPWQYVQCDCLLQPSDLA